MGWDISHDIHASGAAQEAVAIDCHGGEGQGGGGGGQIFQSLLFSVLTGGITFHGGQWGRSQWELRTPGATRYYMVRRCYT